MKEKRLDYELMRIAAIFLVVFNHTDIRGFFLYQVPGGSAVNRMLSLLLATICKIAVPMFFMISGGLLLNRNESISQLFRKRILRMGLVLALFSGILYIFWIHWGFVPHPGAKDFIHRILTEGISIPYWYLYTYLGVLFLFPLLRPMAQNLSDQGYLWLFCVHFGFFGVIVPLSSILRLEPLNQYFITGLTMGAGAQKTPFMAGQAVYYLLMGYYFAHRFPWNQITGKKLLWMGILAAASVCIMARLSWWAFTRRGETSGTYMGALMELVVFFVYALIHQLAAWRPITGKMAKLIRELGSCVFGAYLLEGIFRRELDGIYLFLEPKIHVLPACLCWAAAVVLCGMSVTWVLKRIPGIRKLL